MSRQHSNRPYQPSHHQQQQQQQQQPPAAHLSLPLCEFVSYPTPITADAPASNASWPFNDTLSYVHSPSTLPSPMPPNMSTSNEFSYFPYSTLEPPLMSTADPSHAAPCQYRYLGANEIEPNRPFSRVTVSFDKKIAEFLLHFQFLSGCSNGDRFRASSPSLPFGKSICGVVHSASTLVR